MPIPGETLPSKEQGLFKKMLKHYERKEYKNALKCIKTIQSNPKFENHGDTMSMKAMVLNAMGGTRHEELLEIAREALKTGLRSHLCWHVLGVVLQSGHKYDEACKAYRNALRIDKDNMQILRDLSTLQAQTRDLEGLLETRRQLFQLRPGVKLSWLGYAVSLHLLGQNLEAFELLDEICKINSTPKDYDTDQSELLQYMVTLLEEAGDQFTTTLNSAACKLFAISPLALSLPMGKPRVIDPLLPQQRSIYERALHVLTDFDKLILDPLFILETRGRILIKIGRLSEAEAIYRQLLERNWEKLDYYHFLGLSQNKTAEQLLSIYEEYSKKHPQSTFLRKHILHSMPALSGVNMNTAPSVDQNANSEGQENPEFRASLHRCLVDFIRKGSPALYTTLSLLTRDSHKVRIMGELLQIYWDTLSAEHNLDPQQTPAQHAKLAPLASADQVALGPVLRPAPTQWLWCSYYLAEHLDSQGKHQEALALTDRMLEHTPTLVELYSLKAKIYKHAGDIQCAVRWIEEGQALDTADRFMNSKCVRYLLRANRVAEAEALALKFTREGVPAVKTLTDNQAQWFLYECASAFYSSGRTKYPDALQKCHYIQKIYIDLTEDQLDFHSYCLRKQTLRTYIQLLRHQDTNLYNGNRYFFRAAQLAIRIYLEFDRQPWSASSEDSENAANDATLSEAEKKKLKSKQRRAEKKNTNATNAGSGTSEKKDKEKDKEKDEEGQLKEGGVPTPEVLARNPQPLEAALTFLRPLELEFSHAIETHLLSYEIYERRNFPLRCLWALKRAFRIEDRAGKITLAQESWPRALSILVRFVLKYGKTLSKATPETGTIVDFLLAKELEAFLQSLLQALCAPRVPASCASPTDYLEQVLAESQAARPHSFSTLAAVTFAQYAMLGEESTGTLERFQDNAILKLSALLANSFTTDSNFSDCARILNELEASGSASHLHPALGPLQPSLKDKIVTAFSSRFPLATRFWPADFKRPVLKSEDSGDCVTRFGLALHDHDRACLPANLLSDKEKEAAAPPDANESTANVSEHGDQGQRINDGLADQVSKKLAQLELEGESNNKCGAKNRLLPPSATATPNPTPNGETD